MHGGGGGDGGSGGGAGGGDGGDDGEAYDGEGPLGAGHPLARRQQRVDAPLDGTAEGGGGRRRDVGVAVELADEGERAAVVGGVHLVDVAPRAPRNMKSASIFTPAAPSGGTGATAAPCARRSSTRAVAHRIVRAD